MTAFWSNIKYVFFAILAAGIIWLAVALEKEKSRNKVLQRNQTEWITENANLISQYGLTLNEMETFLKERLPSIEAKLDSARISPRQVERIVEQKIYYRDTSLKKTDLSPILNAIRENKKIVVPVEDKSPCLIVRGTMEYNGQTLELHIADREFTAINQVVGYWERKKWKLFGFIPLRWFGKKEAKLTIFNSCGESKTIVIDKLR